MTDESNEEGQSGPETYTHEGYMDDVLMRRVVDIRLVALNLAVRYAGPDRSVKFVLMTANSFVDFLLGEDE